MHTLSEAWRYVVAAYGDPRFVLVCLVTPLISLGTFLAFALPWTWVAWRNPESLRGYRIQGREIPVARWWWPSLQALAVNGAVGMAGVCLAWPLLSLSALHVGPLPPWYVVLTQLALFVVVDDFLYYWMHRALHTPWLYRHVHAVHHRVTTPCAITGNYMHAAEFLATSTLVLLGPALLGAHVLTLWVWVAFRQLEAADGHSGYDVPWNPALLVPFYKGPAYHDFHHRRFFGNYAGFFRYLDRLFGGYAKGYLDYHRPG